MTQPTPPDAPSSAAGQSVPKIARGDALAQSQDTAAENRRKLMELFPGVLTETDNGLAVDAAALAGYVGVVADEDRRERFGLAWHGKSAARRLALTPSAGTLRPSPGQSVDFDTTQNVLIEGDNLEALKLMQKAYAGRVKLIYIDPPYNTGNDFVYKDDFRDPIGQYKKTVGDVGEDGTALTSNTDSGGRFHTTWLNMMYPRLLLARELLTNQGTVFVSIADHEVHNLRSLLDDVFGQENFIATVIWHKMDSPKNSAIHFSEDHDYVVVYAKNIEQWRPIGLPRSPEMLARYKNPDNDPRGPWLLGDLAARNFYAQGRYPITTKAGRVIDGPPAGSYWRFSQPRLEELDRDKRIWWGESGDNRPGLKRFLSEVKEGVVPQTYWSWKDVGSTRNAKQELSQLMTAISGEDLFITPKPTRLLQRILQLTTNNADADLILDFFAGSGTTGHAVMAQNVADGGNRKFVLVQLPEPTGRADYSTIADLTAERLRRAGAKLKAEHEGTLAAAGAAGSSAVPLDTGFRVFKLDSANVKAWETPTTDTLTAESAGQLIGESVDAVKPDRTPADLLWGAMLNLGLPLDGRVETRTVAGKTVYVAGGGTLIACFDPSIDLPAGESLAIGLAAVAVERGVTGEVTVLLLDKAFAGHDAAKVNLVENLKQRMPKSVTGVRVRSI